MKISKKITAIACILSIFVLSVGCASKDGEAVRDTKSTEVATETSAVHNVNLPEMPMSDKPTEFVRVDMQTGEGFIIHLIPDAAPITVANFQKLVAEGFYNGVTFHRAVPNFVLQGGDPDGNGRGGSKDTIKGEFLTNGIFNPLKHKRGVLSMARTDVKDSATSQFFIVLDSRAGSILNDNYAAFGEVVVGMDVVDKLAALPTKDETIIDKPIMNKVYFITREEVEKVVDLDIGAKTSDSSKPDLTINPSATK